MAGSSLLALIDDIATILDDVSVMTKVAAKKTSGVLGDDLALNAQQVSGIDASREIPVVLKVAQGSAINKVILVPMALLLSYFLPAAITPLLVIGGLFLCYEGFEKVFEKILSYFKKSQSIAEEDRSVKKNDISETDKIKGAVRTDFILSAEIIVITLGTVSTQPVMKQFFVLMSISIIMTVGVYGLVGGIVKLDDLGLWLNQKKSNLSQKSGRTILYLAPYLMKTLGVVGTAAMFLVGGGLVNHSIPALHHLQQSMNSGLAIALDGGVGLIAGGLVAGLIHWLILLIKKYFSKNNRV